MKNNKLKIFTIDTDYIAYLYRFDSNVMFNKETAFTRPYVGIVLNINVFYYFAPLTHNGTRWIGYEDHVILDGGNLGAIKFNKMIPIPPYFVNCLTKLVPIDKYLSSPNKKIKKYGELIRKQYRLINTNDIRYLIKIVSKKVFLNFCLNYKSKYWCNFELLEKISHNWTMTFKAILFLIYEFKINLQKNKIIL